MGHKVQPIIFRIGQTLNWTAKWFARKNFAQQLKTDYSLRQFIQKKLKNAGVTRIEVERSATDSKVIIYTAKPGVVIGRGGVGVEDLKKELSKKFLNNQSNLNLVIKEVENPRLNAELILQEIIEQIEKRIRYRRIMKQVIRQVMEARALGVRVSLSGRLDGVEIARKETLGTGRLPLHTLRADIDYAQGIAQTTYGVIGIKVWIYRGNIFKKRVEEKSEE